MKIGSITTWVTGRGEHLIEIVVDINPREGWVRRRKHWISLNPYAHDVGSVSIRDVRVICE